MCGMMSVEQVKGWTRSSVVMTFLSAATDLDLADPSTAEKLKPMQRVLEKCWLVPCHVSWLQFQTVMTLMSKLL